MCDTVFDAKPDIRIVHDNRFLFVVSVFYGVFNRPPRIGGRLVRVKQCGVCKAPECEKSKEGKWKAHIIMNF